MTPRTNASKKSAKRREGAGLIPKGRRNRRVRKQLAEAIDLVLAPPVDELTPRRYVELMITPSVELGRALRKAIRDEPFDRRRKSRLRDKSWRGEH